jgi:hypothetical protein
VTFGGRRQDLQEEKILPVDDRVSDTLKAWSRVRNVTIVRSEGEGWLFPRKKTQVDPKFEIEMTWPNKIVCDCRLHATILELNLRLHGKARRDDKRVACQVRHFLKNGVKIFPRRLNLVGAFSLLDEMEVDAR